MLAFAAPPGPLSASPYLASVYRLRDAYDLWLSFPAVFDVRPVSALLKPWIRQEDGSRPGTEGHLQPSVVLPCYLNLGSLMSTFALGHWRS